MSVDVCLAAGLHLQFDFSAVFKAFDKGAGGRAVGRVWGGALGVYSSYICDPGEDGGPIRRLADAEPAGGGGQGVRATGEGLAAHSFSSSVRILDQTGGL